MTLPNAVPDGRISDERLAKVIERERREAEKYLPETYLRDFHEVRIAAFTELQSLRSSPSCGGGVPIRPLDTAPSGVDVMEPDEIDIHEGAWALVIGTNGKPAGWIDSHALFAHQIYRDRITMSAPDLDMESNPGPILRSVSQAALEPAEDEPVAWRWRSLKGGWGGRWHTTENPREVEPMLPSHYEVEALFTRPIALAPAVAPCRCEACSKALEFDLLVEDALWARISPRPVEGFKAGGLLCPSCILARVIALPAVVDEAKIEMAARALARNHCGSEDDWRMHVEDARVSLTAALTQEGKPDGLR